MQTTKEWQDSVTDTLKSLLDEFKKLANTISKNTVEPEKIEVEKPVFEKYSTAEIPEVKHNFDTDIEDENFYTRMWWFVAINFTTSITMTVISFYYILIMFGFWFGLSSATFFIIQMLLIDKYLLKGDSLGKIAKNPVAVVGFWAVVAFVFIVCFGIGNTLISDPARGEEYKQANIERQYKDIDTVAPEIDSTGFGSEGSTEK